MTLRNRGNPAGFAKMTGPLMEGHAAERTRTDDPVWGTLRIGDAAGQHSAASPADDRVGA